MRPAGEGGAGAVLFLDLDHFKDVNDSRGHDAGDRLLIAVAARLRAAVGERDTVARLGGDEFAVHLAGVTDPGAAARAADRLLAALAAPFSLDGQVLTTGGSVGIAIADAAYARPEELLRDADLALYRAKAAGRGGYALFDPAMHARLLDRLALEGDLARATERDELRVYYQPMVALSSGRVTYLEALVRWQHPVRGLVAPGDFIPLAEETGLIVPLGRRILATACRQVVAWGRAYPDTPPPGLAVNLSPRQFRDPGLVDGVQAILAETGLAAARLTLEVTESVAMERVEETLATLAALRALGVRLALDDFGTGHSSLAYLRELPLDTLKIDRSFFRDTPQNRVIVRAVTALAHGLGLAVTAEGLETAGQVAWARAAGCDRGQGYYFARPLPPEEIAALWALGLTFALPRATMPGTPPAVPPAAAAASPARA
jgi:diguanylate cyclase (GGDEF)-like protein